MTFGQFLLSLSLLFFITNPCISQVYLQLEKANSTKVIKYAPDSYIEFKTKRYDEYWQNGKIYKILPQDNALAFGDRIVHIDDITYFRYYRKWPQAIGTNLVRFGISWFAFAGIVEATNAIGILDSPYSFGVDTAIIGGTAIVSGYLTKKLFTTVTKKINNKNRLRIIDLHFG